MLNMKENKFFNIKVMCGLFCLMSLSLMLLLFNSINRTKKYEKFVEDMKGELSEEIRRTVEIELKSYLAKEKQDIVLKKEETNKFLSSGNININDIIDQEVIEKNNSQDFVSRIRKLVKEELEYYAGSGVEVGAVISEGLKKSQKISKTNTVYDLENIQIAGIDNEITKEEDLNSFETVGGKEASIERTMVQKGGMLLPKGTRQIEPSITIAHFSSNRINIEGFSILPVLVIGEISTETVKRDIIISNLSLKYGISNNLQGEVSIPYRYEYDRVTDNLGAESVRDHSGLGDISFALSRQLAFEKGIIPDLIGSISIKARNGGSPYNRDIGIGTGHFGIRGGLVAVKSSDPAVVFGGINYTWNVKRDINNFGKVDPGDTIGYTVGAAIALSYQTAINFNFEHSITTKMVKDGSPVTGSFLNAASFKTGFTWAIDEKSTIDVSASMGLTTDSPDFTFAIRLPITF